MVVEQLFEVISPFFTQVARLSYVSDITLHTVVARLCQ